MTDRLLAVSGTETVVIDRESGAVVWQLDSLEGPVSIIAFDSSGESFVVGGAIDYNATAFHPDGTLLLTGGGDGKLLAWEVVN
jgi:WD40 repeat protein